MAVPSNVASRDPLRLQSGIGGSDALLPALQSAHRQIDTALAELEHVASADSLDIPRFNAARMRLAQANLARRHLVNRANSYLTSTLSAEESDLVRALRRHDEDCVQKVSTLVRQWTPEAIANDWGGYSVASRATRAGILTIVAAEKALLYPLLERAS